MGRRMTVERALEIAWSGTAVLERLSSGTWNGKIPPDIPLMPAAMRKLDRVVHAARSLKLKNGSTADRVLDLCLQLRKASLEADSSLLDAASQRCYELSKIYRTGEIPDGGREG